MRGCQTASQSIKQIATCGRDEVRLRLRERTTSAESHAVAGLDVVSVASYAGSRRAELRAYTRGDRHLRRRGDVRVRNS